MMTANSSERGIALVVVLWIVASMGLLVSAFNATVRSGASVIASERVGAERRAALEAGLDITVAQLLADPEGRKWVRDGSARELRLGRHRLRISVLNASGLVDLNQSDEALLRGFLEQVVGDRSDAAMLSDRILDWRDQDNERRFRGAEDFNYERAGQTHGAGDGDFVHVSQLHDVLGIDAATYKRLEPYVTIFNPDGRINPRVASELVLAAVPGVSRQDANRLKSRLEDISTGDDQRRTGRNVEQTSRQRSTGLTRGEQNLTRDLAPANLLTIEILNADGGATFTLQATVLPGVDPSAPYRVLSWRLARSWLQDRQG